MSEKQKKDKLFFNFQLSIINYFVPLDKVLSLKNKN